MNNHYDPDREQTFEEKLIDVFFHSDMKITINEAKHIVRELLNERGYIS